MCENGPRGPCHSPALGHLCHLSNSLQRGPLLSPSSLFYYCYHCEFSICRCKARNADFTRTQGGNWLQRHCVLPSWVVPRSKEVQGPLPKGPARPIISQLNSSLFHISQHNLPQKHIQTRNTQVLFQRAAAPGEHPPGSWVLPSGQWQQDTYLFWPEGGTLVSHQGMSDLSELGFHILKRY